MHPSILIVSALSASAFAMPQGVWKGPPTFSDPPNTRRPTNAPALPVWTAPRPDAGRTSTSRPVVSIPTTTLRPSSTTSSSSRTTSTPTSTTRSITSSTSRSTTSSTPAPSTAVPTSGIPSLSASSTASSSSAVPPTPSGAPLDPGHTPGAGQASLSSGSAYQKSILYHHNIARANHDAAPLIWNDTVAATAKITADTCRFEHYLPPNAGQGQNLFTTSGNYFNVTAGITESWYKGEFEAMRPHFGKPNLDSAVFHEVGHLTQVLWKGTTSVGCYSLDCGDRMVVGNQNPSRLNKYTVCNYYPPGNYGGQYAVNVGFPKSYTALGSWIN
ncbi:hypothetical protein OPT61_g6940 [Boeremia exigua]|uniref:Uncharacterized protein n=1 Tax=Boeremia exigua TaxID=749465 RepID=A0ACC2I4H1_9PLEO|nr:hypothetical protein OPT61_g6940 [Boeremia exigua]